MSPTESSVRKYCTALFADRPYQELDHKEWCLFPKKDEETPADPSLGSADPNHNSHLQSEDDLVANIDYDYESTGEEFEPVELKWRR